ncbi:glucosaminidase domain-containing protein [Pseudidiomarina mangrovi]|uniref:glucosaminidase domain-containing protein n=1 Tax=Pseudidiomarina mangrovi TaxID=2487133 RepID=UPI000FCA85B9|nr:glucosaminidase domain-containing protein [Pseudidiomarina mangrovi]
MLHKLGWLLAAVAVAVAIYLPRYWLQHQPEQLDDNDYEQLIEQQRQVKIYTEVPDFNEFTDVRDKKQAFFQFLAPLVQAENLLIEEQRANLQVLYRRWQQDASSLSSDDLELLEQLAVEYRTDFDVSATSSMFEVLLRRIDVVPETLVLVQAANESGWGTSRFARDGLNFFGQWCFRDGCGMVPENRVEGMNHEVRKFKSVNASIRSYLRNINTHPAYLDLRILREQRRAEGMDIRALDLTPGLLSYSERGEEYIDELNAMIRVNRPIIVELIEADKPASLDPPPQ